MKKRSVHKDQHASEYSRKRRASEELIVGNAVHVRPWREHKRTANCCKAIPMFGEHTKLHYVVSKDIQTGRFKTQIQE